MEKHAQLFSSMHTHTVFCDGRDDIETMCRAAYDKKLYAIGFSSHAPTEKQLGAKTTWNLKDENVSKYKAEVLAAKERWQGKLNVFFGFEADFIEGKRAPADDDITSFNPDFVIGSVHYLYPESARSRQLAPFTIDGSEEEFYKGLNECYDSDARKLMNSYYDTVLEMIDTGGFDILGHVDIIKKNTINKDLWPKENEISRQKEIAQAASKAGLCIEVNTGGINRKKINEVYPSLTFLKIIHEYNIPLMITSDAHNAGDIAGNYNIAVETLKMADINEHYIFNGRINRKIVWIKVKIL